MRDEGRKRRKDESRKAGLNSGLCLRPCFIPHPSSRLPGEGETMPGVRRGACGLLGLLALVAGCQRLNYDKTLTVDGGIPFLVNWDPPRYEQRLTVTVTSTGTPVSAYLVKESD